MLEKSVMNRGTRNRQKMESISQFLHIKEQLAAHLSGIEDAFGKMGAASRISHIAEKEQELKQTNFRVLVCGEFKRGKSCLLNALIGDNVLPMKIAPCTGTVTEVRYGALPKLTLLPTHDEPFTAPFEELRKYTTIQGKKGELLRKVIVDYPSELCQKSITLIDSPGLNEDWSRTKASLREIATADALVLVLSCEMALSRSELQFIETHLKPYASRVFFLWNRADALWDKPDEQAALTLRSDKHLRQYSDNIFFVSAREALLGHLQGSPARFSKSNLTVFIDNLERYLIERMASKKLHNAWQTANDSIIYAQESLIPRLRRLLDHPVHLIEEIQKSNQQTLVNLTIKREEIAATLKEVHREILEDFIAILDSYIEELPSLAFAASVDIVFPDYAHRQEREEVILSWFESWFQDSLQAFVNTKIKPSLEKHFEEVRLDIDLKRQRFYQALFESLKEESEDIILFTGRWIEELSIALSTSLSLLLVNTGREKVLNSLLEIQALRGWLTGKKLIERDRRKLAEQLAVAFQKERESIIFTQRSFLEEEMTKTSNWLDLDLKRSMFDAKEQIEFALTVRKEGVQSTEERQIQLEEAHLMLCSIQAKLLEVKDDVRGK